MHLLDFTKTLIISRFAGVRLQPVYSFIIGAFCLVQWAQAQTIKRCGSTQLDSLRKANNPAYARSRERLNQMLREIPSKAGRRTGTDEETTYYIPVVVHVVHNTKSGVVGGNNNPNISDEQIVSQIEVLNEDYRRQPGTNGFNTHPDGADVNIEFRLATRDPQGQSTSGITRHYSSKANYSTGELDQLARIAYWPSDRYLNIWVTQISSDFIGYAQFPDATGLPGLADINGEEQTDGVMIDYRNFGRIGTAATGSYNLGRTTTHEIGHWLGLIHTWGDEECGNDYCDDTPVAFDENGTLSCDDKFSKCSGSITRNMIENYLDYSPDRCMNIFTQDQKNRIRSVLELSPRRKKLVESANDMIPDTEKLQVTVVNNPAVQQLTLKIQFKGTQRLEIELLDVSGKQAALVSFPYANSGEFPVNTLGLRQGLYLVRTSIPKETQIKKVWIFN